MEEIGRSPIPGLYVLLDERAEKRAYIGQTEDIRARLLTHIRAPEDKIQQWQLAFLFNDGRSASQSDLNDENIRLTLENYLLDLVNTYPPVSLRAARGGEAISRPVRGLLRRLKPPRNDDG